jgi:hypothetical protein
MPYSYTPHSYTSFSSLTLITPPLLLTRLHHYSLTRATQFDNAHSLHSLIVRRQLNLTTLTRFTHSHSSISMHPLYSPHSALSIHLFTLFFLHTHNKNQIVTKKGAVSTHDRVSVGVVSLQRGVQVSAPQPHGGRHVYSRRLRFVQGRCCPCADWGETSCGEGDCHPPPPSPSPLPPSLPPYLPSPLPLSLPPSLPSLPSPSLPLYFV